MEGVIQCSIFCPEFQLVEISDDFILVIQLVKAIELQRAVL